MSSKILQVVAVGSAPPALLRELTEPLRAQLDVAATPAKVQLQSPAYAFNKDRKQYHSNAIMRRLVPLLDKSTPSFILGVLDVDLFVPDAAFVFGEADREARIALVSMFRMRDGASGETLRRRFQVEAVHQSGHLLGLSYCEDARCVMFAAQSVQEVDRKGLSLCNLCRNELAKINR
jgi:archaemetzincin